LNPGITWHSGGKLQISSVERIPAILLQISNFKCLANSSDLLLPISNRRPKPKLQSWFEAGLPDVIFSNQNFGKYWNVLPWKMLVKFMAIWSILLPFRIIHGHLVYFVVIWVYFLVGCTKKNLATLVRGHFLNLSIILSIFPRNTHCLTYLFIANNLTVWPDFGKHPVSQGTKLNDLRTILCPKVQTYVGT
jgi:hypothetical protein